MSNIDENIRTLFDLGLSNAQAKSYLALVRIGSASIREIADVSKVARPDTYRAFIDLLQMGLVKKIVTVPTKYKAMSITDVVGFLMMKRTKESIDLNKKANKLIHELEEKENAKSLPEGNQFVLIRGEAIELEFQKHCENAKDKISIMTSRERLLRLVAINNVIFQNALKRNVTLRIITEESYGSNDSRILQPLEIFTNFEHRYGINPLEVWLSLYDDKEILLATSTKLAETNRDAVFSNNSCLVELAQSYFNAAWFSASIPQNQAFRRDRRQFDYLFANLNSGFSYNKIIFGSDGKPIDFIILATNLAFKKITGIQKKILGERGTKVFPSGIQTNLLDLLATYWPIISNGKSARFEYCFQGSERCFSILAYSPEKGYFVIIFEDITNLKKAEKANLLLASIVESSEDAIISKSLDGIITSWNRGAEKIYGYKAAEVMGKSIQILATPEKKDEISPILKRIGAGEQIRHYETKRLRKDGTEIDVSIAISPINSEKGTIVGASTIAREITQRKKAE